MALCGQQRSSPLEILPLLWLKTVKKAQKGARCSRLELPRRMKKVRVSQGQIVFVIIDESYLGRHS